VPKFFYFAFEVLSQHLHDPRLDKKKKKREEKGKAPNVGTTWLSIKSGVSSRGTCFFALSDIWLKGGKKKKGGRRKGAVRDTFFRQLYYGRGLPILCEGRKERKKRKKKKKGGSRRTGRRLLLPFLPLELGA